MTSLLFANYCVSPATSSEKLTIPPFSVKPVVCKRPCTLLIRIFLPYYNIDYCMEPAVPVFLDGRGKTTPIRDLPLNAQAEIQLAWRVPIIENIVVFW